jgi:hypothetical protein
MTDTERLDWLEQSLLHINHSRASCSVTMDGKKVCGQFRSANTNLLFRVNHQNIRAAIDDAIEAEKTQ